MIPSCIERVPALDVPDGTARKQNMGHFFMAIDVETFTPGEKEWLKEKMVFEQGIPINANLQRDLQAVRDILDLKGYDYLFSGKDGDLHG